MCARVGKSTQLRRFLGFDTECKKLTPTGGDIIMRALEPEVANVVWTAVEALIPSREDNHPLRCHNHASRTVSVLWGSWCGW